MDVNIRQHEELQEGLDRLKEYVTACLDPPQREVTFDAEQYINLIDSFAYDFRQHLVDEIGTFTVIDVEDDEATEKALQQAYLEWDGKMREDTDKVRSLTLRVVDGKSSFTLLSDNMLRLAHRSSHDLGFIGHRVRRRGEFLAADPGVGQVHRASRLRAQASECLEVSAFGYVGETEEAGFWTVGSVIWRSSGLGSTKAVRYVLRSERRFLLFVSAGLFHMAASGGLESLFLHNVERQIGSIDTTGITITGKLPRGPVE